MSRYVSLSLLAVSFLGCAETAPNTEHVQQLATSTPLEIDILFVIDKSGSMAQEQASLAIVL